MTTTEIELDIELAPEPPQPCRAGTVPEVGHARLCIEPKGHEGLHRAYFNEKPIVWGITR